MALATYADDSLAGYSVFSDGDTSAIRDRIEVAYRVLVDPEARSVYDVTIDGSENLLDPASDVVATSREAPPAALPRVEEPSRDLESIDEFDDLDNTTGEFDGARLRRYRLRCGMELEDIAGITKINNSNLLAIEEERFGDLPSKVYVRGFVTAFASTLGLDTKAVAASYMRLYDDGQESRPKSRFF
jgi:hypothetical protein